MMSLRHSRPELKPADYDSLPFRDQTTEYVINQRYRDSTRPGFMFTYLGVDGNNIGLQERSFLRTTNGVQQTDVWSVCSWP